MAKHPGGRPTIMTPDVINKLEQVFALGGTDKEACFYAGISHQALYNYQERYPEFVERKEALKMTPILKARQTIVKSLDDPNHAFRYARSKLADEFGDKLDIKTSGTLTVVPDERILELAKKLNK